MSAAVTFSTKCWERDYRRVLCGGAAEQARRCGYDFARRAAWVNNVLDAEAVKYEAECALSRGDVDEVQFVDDHADAALRYFCLTREDLGVGYVYSICEMAEIPWCSTPYLVHLSGDALATGPWVERGVEILESDPRVSVVNPLWNGRVREALAESLEERDDHWLGRGFSDQCYLIRVGDFRADVLRETHPAGARYPAYGGELFEKRVDAWMRNHDRLRATLKTAVYVHPWKA